MIILSAAALAAGVPAVPGATNPAVTQDNLEKTICNKTLYGVDGQPVPLDEAGKPTEPGFTWVHWQRPPTSYTNAIKYQLMDAAGIPRSQSGKFELDHRDAIEDAGDPKSKFNLWLQPWTGAWNAHMKDALENFIHRQICDGSIKMINGKPTFMGKMSLAQGQAVFLGDWRISYTKFIAK